MEGTLWKWTNYWNGWQTRWFILENGILSYYKSHDEVSQGCKGSVKVMACQINVNSLDSTRLDVVIPGEQHMYLRASTAQERQMWLVALGSAKACVDGNAVEQKATDTNSLMHKKYELRLYCDLMMQQVHAVKNVTRSEKGVDENMEIEALAEKAMTRDLHKKVKCLTRDFKPKTWLIEDHEGSLVSEQKMDDATILLGATCDTFIRTLEDCMKLANAQTNNPGPLESPNTTSQPISGKIQTSQSMISQKVCRQNIPRSVSQEDT